MIFKKDQSKVSTSSEEKQNYYSCLNDEKSSKMRDLDINELVIADKNDESTIGISYAKTIMKKDLLDEEKVTPKKIFTLFLKVLFYCLNAILLLLYFDNIPILNYCLLTYCLVLAFISIFKDIKLINLDAKKESFYEIAEIVFIAITYILFIYNMFKGNKHMILSNNIPTLLGYVIVSYLTLFITFSACISFLVYRYKEKKNLLICLSTVVFSGFVSLCFFICPLSALSTRNLLYMLCLIIYYVLLNTEYINGLCQSKEESYRNITLLIYLVSSSFWFLAFLFFNLSNGTEFTFKTSFSEYN